MSHSEKIMAIITGIGVFISAIYVVISAITLKTISRQTGHAEDAAKASLRNADAIIKAERAWLLIEMIGDPYVMPQGEPDISIPRTLHCIISLKNFGNTPAKVVFNKCGLFRGESRSMPPFGPDGSQNIFIPNPIFAENPDVVAPQTGRKYEATLEPYYIPKENIVGEEMIFWVCGIVRYDDVFSKELQGKHETRFCLFCNIQTNTSMANWVVAGPPEFNQAT